jgi:hypothetical protein
LTTGELDRDGDGFRACEECDDSHRWAYPGADELCNGEDDDCDGAVDEGCPPPPEPEEWTPDRAGGDYVTGSDSGCSCLAPSRSRSLALLALLPWGRRFTGRAARRGSRPERRWGSPRRG